MGRPKLSARKRREIDVSDVVARELASPRPTGLFGLKGIDAPEKPKGDQE